MAASAPASFTDLSGVVQTLVNDLEGKVLSQMDLIKNLPALVLKTWTLNLPIEKAEAQILAAVKHLITKFVPTAEQSVVIDFVDTTFPVLVAALHSLIEQVKAEVLKKATDVAADVAEKVEAVCSKSCIPWFSGCLSKSAKGVPAVAAAPAAAAAAPAAAAAAAAPAAVPALVESVKAAASADISAALTSVKEVVTEPVTESKA